MCGTHLRRLCTGCGALNPLNYRFCGMCGGALLDAPAELPGVSATPAEMGAALALPQPASLPVAATPAPAPLVQLEGERRVASIIVADVCGSTQLLEKLGTEAWVALMNHVLQLLEAEIYRFGGVIDQFRGDGLLAFFGTTAVHEDDPERAVLAALRMQEVIQTYAGVLAEQQGIELLVRIGVNTGVVIVASVGSRQYSEDTAMGEAVTLAARLEAAAAPGTVLASENTYRLVAPRFEWQSLGAMAFKGLSEPVLVYRPIAPRQELGLLPDVESYELATPLIGREHEFDVLSHCIADLYDARGGIAVVTGVKGMGKSFLVAQVYQYLERQRMLLDEARSRDTRSRARPPDAAPTIMWLRGRCRSYDQSWPYSLWLDLLYDWLGMRKEEPPAQIQARLREQAEALWGAQYADYYPYLATFLALPVEPEFAARVRHLSAESLQQQLFAAVRAWVEALARRGPTVFSLADMQWADTTSLALLRYCLSLCDTTPLLWLLVFRPERASSVWEFYLHVQTEYPHRLTDVPIPTLTEAQSVKLLESFVGRKALPDEAVKVLLHKAEGNPYYIKELVGALLAQGVLAADGESGRFHLTRPVASLDLPDSLQTLLMARLDRLSAEERHVLQMASVIGTVFWLNVLESLIPGASELSQHLTNLQRLQLIQERRRSPDLGMEYSFLSSLMRDVAYESLLSAQRAGQHLQVAEALERLFRDNSSIQPYGLLAYHYREAGRLERALTLLLQAAAQARKFYANAEALEHYTTALELLDALEAQAVDAEAAYTLRRQRFEVLNARREAHYLLGRMDLGRADAQRMLELAQGLERDPALRIDALLEQPGVNIVQNREELHSGIGIAYEALERARQLGDRAREMRSLILLTNLHNLRNDPAWHGTGHYALELARQLGDRRAEVEILLRLGWAYGVDNPEQSMACFEAALPIAQSLDDRNAEIRLLSAMRTPLERSGDYYRILEEYDRKRLAISREIGNRYAEAGALTSCGQVEGVSLGNYKAALALEEEALRIWGESNTGRLYPLLRIAQMQIALGEFAEAEATLQRARPAVEQEVRELGRAGLALVSALLCNAIGDAPHLRQVLEITAGVHQLVGDSLVSRQYDMAAFCEECAAQLQLAALTAEPDARAEHCVAALHASQAALGIYEHFGFVQIVECSSEEVLYRHSLALAANGQEAAAQPYAQRARAELARKHALIPADSPFSHTFLENISIHQEIAAIPLIDVPGE